MIIGKMDNTAHPLKGEDKEYIVYVEHIHSKIIKLVLSKEVCGLDDRWLSIYLHAQLHNGGGTILKKYCSRSETFPHKKA